MNAAPLGNPSLEGLSLSIPTLPHTFLLAMGLSRDMDNVEIDEVADIIQNDPGAVTRILHVVNSAFHGLRSEITNVKRAVIALGPEAVLGILMSMGMIDMQQSMDLVSHQTFRKLVRHSIATGYLSRQLVLRSSFAKEEGPEGRDIPNEAFMMGLLHDFGKIVLMSNFPNEAVKLYGRQEGLGITVAELRTEERETFGFDHVEAGEYLMNELNFLHSMTNVVAYHHDWRNSEHINSSTRVLLHFTVASNKLANALGLEFNNKITRQSLQEDPIWDVLFSRRLFPESDKEILLQELFELDQKVELYVNEVM